jgi:cbb3-type cytochrome oxidase maturation protein
VSLGILIGLSLALGVAAWLFFMWTVRSGQYEDPEGAKYRMLEDDDGERKPAPPANGRGAPAAPAAGEAHRGPERSP